MNIKDVKELNSLMLGPPRRVVWIATWKETRAKQGESTRKGISQKQKPEFKLITS